MSIWRTGPRLVAGLLALAGCAREAGDAPAASRAALIAGGGEVVGTVPAPSADLRDIAVRLDAILALGYNTVNADAVARQLMNRDPAVPASTLFVLDVRDPADFAAGHIPGAVNVPLAQLPEVLLASPGLVPADKEVVVASYLGSDGNMASLLVNAARIADPVAQKAAQDAKQPLPYRTSKALFAGMTSWSFDRDLGPTRFDDDLGTHRLERATQPTANPTVAQGAFPALAAFAPEIDTVVEKILVRASRYLAEHGPVRGIQTTAVALAANLDDGNAANDPQIVSVRTAVAYAQGHIPGAVNIQYQSVANLDAWTKFVSPTKDVVVYCFTGHTGALATMSLGILGYAVENVLYGMNGWTTSTAVSSGQLKSFDLLKGWDLPLHDWGTGIDALATYAPPSQGCTQCHTTLVAILCDTWANPSPAAPPPASTGEG